MTKNQETQTDHGMHLDGSTFGLAPAPATPASRGMAVYAFGFDDGHMPLRGGLVLQVCACIDKNSKNALGKRTANSSEYRLDVRVGLTLF
jgi:hypothetical protein